MKRFALALAGCAVAAGLFSAAAWAAGDAAQYLPPASHLKGIKDLLGGFLLFRVIPWTAVGLVGLMLLASALSPERVARAQQALRLGRWRVVLVGVASIVVLFGLAAALSAAARHGAGALGVIALVLLGFLVWLAVLGLAATAQIVGQRLLGPEGGAGTPWRVAGAGALVVAASILVPVFGWAVFIYLFCRGVGGATLALFSGNGGAAPKADEA